MAFASRSGLIRRERQTQDKKRPRFFNRGLFNGGSCGIRTYDQLVKSQLLYQLS